MKKIMQRFFGIVACAALLVTSSMTVWAAEPGHSHGGGTVIDDKTGPYTITLTHPDGTTTFDDKSHYGAYQVFSGTVKGKTSHENPGSNSEEIPITDIKWGNAFGIVGEEENEVSQDVRNQNILGFIYALSQAQTGDYKYAYGDFDGFSDLFTKEGVLNTDYVIGEAEVKVTLADGKVTSVENDSNVNYDKLAVHIADVLADPKHVDDHEWLQAFNDILGGYGQGEYGNYKNSGYVDRFYEGGPVANSEGKNATYQIKVPAGYYMIRDLSSFTGANKAYSARMLFVADNVKQELKEDIPKLDKHISRDSGYFETEAAGVGDEVKFRLTGTLPSNYDLYLGGYQYKFTDTLSKGLTLKEIEVDTYVTVKVKGVYNGDTFDDKTEYTIKTDSFNKDETHTHTHAAHDVAYTEEYNKETNVLTVSFPCLKEIKITADGKTYTLGVDSEIYIDYTAVVNENAVVSPDNGNENTAVLTYSDNPQSYGDTDNTTIDRATVYTFGLDIIKIDAADFLRTGKESESALKDAKFAVVRPVKDDDDSVTGWEIAKFTKEYIGTQSDTTLPKMFQYYGYYSIVSWETLNTDGPEGSTAATGTTFSDEWLEKYTDDVYNITSLADGILNISGLDDGVTYTIVETATPDDETYAKIDPFTITLTAAKKGDEYTGKLESAKSEQQIEEGKSFTFAKPVEITDTFDGDPVSESDGSANMLVANFKYTDLPSTGGVGTYWYYIIGVGGIVISAVLFILSKKKNAK